MNKIVEVLPMIDQVYVRWIIHGATLRLTYSNLLIPPFPSNIIRCVHLPFLRSGLWPGQWINWFEKPTIHRLPGRSWARNPVKLNFVSQTLLSHLYWIHGNALELEHWEFVPVLHPSIYYLRRWTWRAGWQGWRGGWGAPSPGQLPSRRPALGRWGLAASVFGTFQHCGRLG